MRFSSFITRLTGALTILNFCIGSLALLPSAVIVPLYIYPGNDCISWTPLLTAIPAHPNLEFIIVINPANGPGSAGSQPDANYRTCVARLRDLNAAIGNVKLLGYVATGFGARSLENITTDIDTYAGWNKAYRPVGIFFDEAANVPDPKVVAKYRSYAAYAKMKLPGAYITLNPGAWPNKESESSPEYSTISDLIVTFENTDSNFAISKFPSGTSIPRKKQAAIIHTGPMIAPIQTVRDITQTLKLGASFYSDFPNTVAYHRFPTDWVGYLNKLELTQAKL